MREAITLELSNIQTRSLTKLLTGIDWSNAGKEQSVADFKANTSRSDFRKIFLKTEVNKTLPKSGQKNQRLSSMQV